MRVAVETCCELLFSVDLLAVGCYVRLHGFGLADSVSGDDWYISLALNDVVYLNVTWLQPPDERGFFTYIVRPGDCTATDFQYFDTYDDPSESPRLVSYLNALTDGSSVCYTTL